MSQEEQAPTNPEHPSQMPEAAEGLSAQLQLRKGARTFRVGTIRARLLISFTIVALLSVAVVAAAQAITGLQSGQRQAIAQLESVARIKEAEIGTWVDNLQSDLGSALGGAQAGPRAIALLQTSDPSDSQVFWMRNHLQAVTEQAVRLDELFLVDLQGQVILSTDLTNEGQNHGDQVYFQQGLSAFYLGPPTYSDALGRVSMFITQPVIGPDAQPLGIVAGRVNHVTLSAMMGERARLGNTGEVFLVDRNQRLLTPLRSDVPLGTPMKTRGVVEAIGTQSRGSESYADHNAVSVIGMHDWLPELQIAMVAKQDQAEAFATIYSTLRIIGLVALGALAVAVAASLFITQGIAKPLANLTETTARIAAGELSLTAPVERDDEIGALARAFNSMTAQLRQTLAGLEQQVAERTADLEATTADLAARGAELEEANQRQREINRQLSETVRQSQRRAMLLQASAEVSRAATQIRDLDQLLPQATQLISQHFGFYHTGVFLIDEAGRYAVLEAANSPGGQRMLDRQHKLGVGTQGIVGYVTASGQPRIALNVGKDAVYFDNPDLPDTRSEMAVPLRIGDAIIGALDVQSIDENAFDEEDVNVLTALADQIAVAIQNARLFEQSQTAVEEAHRTQRRYLQHEWSQFVQEQLALAHEYTLSGVQPVGDAPLPEVEEALRKGELIIVDPASAGEGETQTDNGYSARAALAVPIKVRDEIIGILDLQETDVERVWTEDEIALIQAVADQLGQALEGARLFEQTQTSLAETRTLFETSRSLAAAQEMEEIWQAIIAAAQQRRANGCGLFLFDTLERETARGLVLAAGWDQGHDSPQLPVGTHLPLSGFEDFDAMRPDQHYCVTDLEQAPRVNQGTRQLMSSLGFSALLHQPIAVRNRWFGLLTILYQSSHQFTTAEIDFYRTLADQTALAIEGKRLLDQTQRRAEREQMIRQITDKVHATPDVQAILQTTVQELGKALGLPRVFVRLGTEEALDTIPQG